MVNDKSVRIWKKAVAT